MYVRCIVLVLVIYHMVQAYKCWIKHESGPPTNVTYMHACPVSSVGRAGSHGFYLQKMLCEPVQRQVVQNTLKFVFGVVLEEVVKHAW